MPHLRLEYSADVLGTAVHRLFDEIESCINHFDPTTGICKCRAYPARIYKHSHIMIGLWLLSKPHRDSEYSQSLLKLLKDCVQKRVLDHCYVSVQLYYRNDSYSTIE